MSIESAVDFGEDVIVDSRKFERWMSKARKAYENGDYRDYSEICNEHGIEPWDAEAYERGNADALVARQNQANYVKNFVPKNSPGIRQSGAHYQPSTVGGMRLYIRRAAEANPDSKELKIIAEGVYKNNLDALMEKCNEVRKLAKLPEWEWEWRGHLLVPCPRPRSYKRRK